jgi:transcription elongation factor Elf1
MRTKLSSIELIPAFLFDCDICGTENFVRAISEDDEETGLTYVETPIWVECGHCGATFEKEDLDCDE